MKKLLLLKSPQTKAASAITITKKQISQKRTLLDDSDNDDWK